MYVCVHVCVFYALQAVHPDIQQQVFEELVAAGLAAAGEPGWRVGITQLHPTQADCRHTHETHTASVEPLLQQGMFTQVSVLL